MTVKFEHVHYDLIDGDRIVRKINAPIPSRNESYEVIQELGRFVEAKIVNDYNFSAIILPTDDSNPSTSILASSDWHMASKLLLIIHNASGSMMGIFSRSLCLDKGLSKGTMLPYIDRAIKDGYGVLILRPNTNSVVEEVPGEEPRKVFIPGSENPELHALCVWENVVKCADNATHIAVLGYGNGGVLCKEILFREFVRLKENKSYMNRIRGIITIEASVLIEEDDARDIKSFIESVAVNLECNRSPRGFRLDYRKEKLGYTSMSLGIPDGTPDDFNAASSIYSSLDPVFQYLAIAESSQSPAARFATDFALKCGHANPNVAIVAGTGATDESASKPMTKIISNNNIAESPTVSPTERKEKGFFSSFFSGSKDKGKTASKADEEEHVSIKDFDLLHVVGKGAFGKVLLVRKKTGISAGQVFAIKVLKKSEIAAKGQVENTVAERDILYETRHPFIVRLHFAFQSDTKLYLVTKYYNGGTLFYHLRRSKYFSEERARFYASELMLALEHLHAQFIIYRDLKLENILLDYLGHIALTDFGLSKRHIDHTGGAQTFCGTAEYIAPEMLQDKRYGVGIDWWSFGILLYEMIYGQTPFYDKNPKLLFYKIVHTEPKYHSCFSAEAFDCIKGLLRIPDTDRLGCGPNGSRDIKNTVFFAAIDFDKLYRKEIIPPFKPDVTDESDLKYVNESIAKSSTKESFSEPLKRNDPNEKKFADFSYAGDLNIDDEDFPINR